MTSQQLSTKINFWIGLVTLSLFVGAITTLIIFKSLNKAPKVTEQTIVPVVPVVPVVQVVEAKERFCDTPIKCIRDVGEELGETNDHIMAMIRLAKCESGMRPDALNKNTNGTFDIGLLQVNDVHSKRISRQDRMDYEKNIRFSYKLHQEQDHKFTAWSCWKKITK